MKEFNFHKEYTGDKEVQGSAMVKAVKKKMIRKKEKMKEKKRKKRVLKKLTKHEKIF